MLKKKKNHLCSQLVAQRKNTWVIKPCSKVQRFQEQTAVKSAHVSLASRPHRVLFSNKIHLGLTRPCARPVNPTPLNIPFCNFKLLANAELLLCAGSGSPFSPCTTTRQLFRRQIGLVRPAYVRYLRVRVRVP